MPKIFLCNFVRLLLLLLHFPLPATFLLLLLLFCAGQLFCTLRKQRPKMRKVKAERKKRGRRRANGCHGQLSKRACSGVCVRLCSIFHLDFLFFFGNPFCCLPNNSPRSPRPQSASSAPLPMPTQHPLLLQFCPLFMPCKREQEMGSIVYHIRRFFLSVIKSFILFYLLFHLISFMQFDLLEWNGIKMVEMECCTICESVGKECYGMELSTRHD